MITQCTHCKHQCITDRRVYDSPIFTCEACGEQYYDHKFREASLLRRPTHALHANFRPLLAAAICILIFVINIVWDLHYSPTSIMVYCIAIILFLAKAFFSTVLPVYYYITRKKVIDKTWNASRQRLLNPEYQQLLVRCSQDPENTVAQLRKFCRDNGMDLWKDWCLPPDAPTPVRRTMEDFETDTKISQRIKKYLHANYNRRRGWHTPITTPEQIMNRCRIARNVNNVAVFEDQGSLFLRDEFIYQFALAHFNSDTPKWALTEQMQQYEDDLIISASQDADLATIEGYQLAIFNCKNR